MFGELPMVTVYATYPITCIIYITVIREWVRVVIYSLRKLVDEYSNWKETNWFTRIVEGYEIKNSSISSLITVR